MARIGRNDPCPCGSGKKYKNCCLSKDRVARIRESAWMRDEQTLMDSLLAFAQRPNFSPQTVVASNLFWNGNYGVEGINALDRDEIGRFLDWYLFDYRLEQSQQGLIELFMQEMGPGLSAPDRERARAWQDSYMSLYRISGSESQGMLSIVDAMQGNRETISDTGLGRLGLPGDLVLGRVLRSSDSAHFSWAAVLLPAAAEAALTSFGNQAYAEYQQTHSEASWPRFMCDFGYTFNHYLLKSAAEEGKAGHVSGAYYDALPTVEKLRQVEFRLRERAARAAGKQLHTGQGTEKKAVEPEPLRQTKGGILLPGHVRYKGSRVLTK